MLAVFLNGETFHISYYGGRIVRKMLVTPVCFISHSPERDENSQEKAQDSLIKVYKYLKVFSTN